MMRVAPTNLDLCLPFEIGDGESDRGARLGGRCPDIRLPPLRPEARYVLTFPVACEPELDASVFVNCDFDALLVTMNDGVRDDDQIVIELHEPAARGRSAAFASKLSSHPIILGEPRSDWEDDGEGRRVPRSSHKLGGRPYCIQERELPGAAELLADGWIHALQLDFPARSSVQGPWPFADGLLNVFVDPERDRAARWAFQK